MKITSKEFIDKERIPQKFTADGENINPELIIFDIPKETKSLVLVCEDPDAQKVAGFTWIHWVVFDILVNDNKIIIKENSIPGKSGDSTYHKQRYSGPSPSAGDGIHNYYFKAFALSDMLNLEEMTTLNQIHNAMKDLIIEKAEIIAIYSRG